MSSYIKRFPLWQRYIVAFTGAAVIVVALVLYVQHNQQPLQEAAAASNRTQQVQTDKQDKILVEQQQAPRLAKLAPHQSAVAGASAAITAFMTMQVKKAFVTGPLDGKASCTPAGGTAARAVVHCNVTAGDRANDTSLRYPFDAVVIPSTHTVTYCQVVTSPGPEPPSPPISSACR